jgi:hypothetical protein
LRGICLAVFRQEFDAADAGKDDVGNDEVVGTVLEKGESGFGAVGDVHFIALSV